MNFISKVRDIIVKIVGVYFMALVLFYLNYYEFNPIYEPKSN